MLLSTPTIIAALFATIAFADECGPGEWRKNKNTCKPCLDGYISTITSPDGGPLYSCTPCPPGQTSNGAHTMCVKCEPGTFNAGEGGKCTPCASGQFNDVYGAKSCCLCCAGFFSDNQRVLCHQCPPDRPFSYPGANARADCKSVAARTSEPNPVTSCDMVSDNVCPNTVGTGPVGTAISRKKRDLRCAQGFTACPRYSGRGGFDCVDLDNDPESCGGCVGLEGEGTGTDCTAIKGASVTRCVKRSCVVDTCRKGWTKSIDGTSCVLVSHPTRGVHAQDPEVKRKTTTSAKRAIRAKIF